MTWRSVVALTAMMCVLGHCVRAEPPEAGTPQSDLLAPYGDWIRSLTNPTNGEGCCSLADCRAPLYRTTADGYEAFIDHSTYPRGPDKWLKVPDSVILHSPNDTGLAIACWASWHKTDNGFYCFALPGGF